MNPFDDVEWVHKTKLLASHHGAFRPKFQTHVSARRIIEFAIISTKKRNRF